MNKDIYLYRVILRGKKKFFTCYVTAVDVQNAYDIAVLYAGHNDYVYNPLLSSIELIAVQSDKNVFEEPKDEC